MKPFPPITTFDGSSFPRPPTDHGYRDRWMRFAVGALSGCTQTLGQDAAAEKAAAVADAMMAEYERRSPK